MESKTVIHSVGSMPGPSATSQLVRALSLLVSQGGTVNTSERWFHTAVSGLVKNGVLRREEYRVSLGDNFESTLIDLMKVDPDFVDIYREYRGWVTSMSDIEGLEDNEAFEEIQRFHTTDQQLMYAAYLISDLSSQVAALREVVSNMATRLNEMSINQSVLEAVVYDADTDG